MICSGISFALKSLVNKLSINGICFSMAALLYGRHRYVGVANSLTEKLVYGATLVQLY